MLTPRAALARIIILRDSCSALDRRRAPATTSSSYANCLDASARSSVQRWHVRTSLARAPKSLQSPSHCKQVPANKCRMTDRQSRIHSQLQSRHRHPRIVEFGPRGQPTSHKDPGRALEEGGTYQAIKLE